MKKRKAFSMLMALVLSLAMVIGLIPMTAMAATPNDLKATIEAVPGLFATVDGNTITVTGSATNVYGLRLVIDPDVTVVWKAEIIWNQYNQLIISGGGTLEVATGGSIVNPGAGRSITLQDNTAINVTGGTVRAISSAAILTTGSNTSVTVSDGLVENVGSPESTISDIGSNTTITVSGGTVRSTNETNTTSTTICAISAGSNSNVIISGGTVIADVSPAIRMGGVISSSTLIISDGLVSSNASNFGTLEISGTTLITGGIVKNNAVSGGYAITGYNSSMLFVNGGTVEANSGVKYDLRHLSVAIEKIGDTNVYISGTSVDLAIVPETGASAEWAVENDKHGIAYARSTNRGFIEVPGVRVNIPQPEGLRINDDPTLYTNMTTFNSALTDALNLSDTVTVSGKLSNSSRNALTVPNGKTVVWKAEITGGEYNNWQILSISGGGVFEVASGGVIRGTGNAQPIRVFADTTVNITGGTIAAEVNAAIWGYDDNTTVTIDDGVVESTATTSAVIGNVSSVTVNGGAVSNAGTGPAILQCEAVSITGGTVISNSASAIIDASDTYPITISGGVVSSASSNGTVFGRGRVWVTGGEVRNTAAGGYAISCFPFGFNVGSVVYVNGGVLIADEKYNLGPNVIAIEKTGTANEYISGTSTDLVVEPSTAAAVWAVEGGISGIGYEYNTNKGFIEVPGVVVNTPSTEGLRVNGSETLYKSVSEVYEAIRNALVSNVTVTVSGKLSNVDSTLTLNIPAGKTVVWAAEYSAETTGGTTYPLINVAGSGGTFEVATGSVIEQAGEGNAISMLMDSKVNVTGGVVSASSGAAISVGPRSDLNIAGGTVSAVSSSLGRAIEADFSTLAAAASITVSDGIVEGAGTVIYNNNNTSITVCETGVVRNTDRGLAIRSIDKGRVTISGGLVVGRGIGAIVGKNIIISGGLVSCDAVFVGTIMCFEGNMWVTGGTISNTAYYGILIHAWSLGTVYVSGGTLIGDTKYSVSDYGVVIEKAGNASDYIAGRSDDLTMVGGIGSAVWAFENNQHGIRYQKFTITGFIEIPGVTVSLSPIVLTDIAVTEYPDKTEYIVGEALDLEGMAVTATYSDDNTKAVTDYTTDPIDGAVLSSLGQQTVTVSYTEGGITETATFTVTVNAALTYTASIDPFTSHTFYSAVEGYTEQAAQVFTITNTGTGTLTGLAAALSSGANFEISAILSGRAAAPGETVTVSVRPKTGLAVGYYTDALTVTGDNGISLTVNLGFTVEAKMCAHIEDNGTVTTPATCEEDGVRTFKCTICGDTLRTAPIAKLAHIEDSGTATTAPTCHAEGVTTFKCTRCGDTLRTAPIAKLNHIEDSGTVTTPATCEADGVRTFKCTLCSDTLRTAPITKLAHDFSVRIGHKDATATEDGYTIFKCSRCDETNTVVIPKTGKATIVSAVTTPNHSIRINETAKNSRIWVLTFSVTLTYSDGTTEVVGFFIELKGNNANLDGRYSFASDHPLAGYTIVYDIKGNGSNIKDFRLIKN